MNLNTMKHIFFIAVLCLNATILLSQNIVIEQVGQELSNDDHKEFGMKSVLNKSGNIILSIDYETSTAHIYKLKNSQWELLGNPVKLPVYSIDKSSLSINESGTTIGIGILDQGIFVYDFNNGDWESRAPLGLALKDGAAVGRIIKLNNDGKIMCFNSNDKDHPENVFGAGAIRVCEYVNDQWVQKGQKNLWNFSWSKFWRIYGFFS